MISLGYEFNKFIVNILIIFNFYLNYFYYKRFIKEILRMCYLLYYCIINKNIY